MTPPKFSILTPDALRPIVDDVPPRFFTADVLEHPAFAALVAPTPITDHGLRRATGARLSDYRDDLDITLLNRVESGRGHQWEKRR